MGFGDWFRRALGADATPSVETSRRQDTSLPQGFSYNMEEYPSTTSRRIVSHAVQTATGNPSVQSRLSAYLMAGEPDAFVRAELFVSTSISGVDRRALQDSLVARFEAQSGLKVERLNTVSADFGHDLLSVTAKTSEVLLNGMGRALDAPYLNSGLIAEENAMYLLREQQREQQRQAQEQQRQAQETAKLEMQRRKLQNAEQDVRGDLSRLYRDGVVRTEGRADVPFSQFVNEEQLQRLVYRNEEGGLRISTEKVHALSIDSPHVKRQVVAGIADIALRNDIMDTLPLQMLNRYGLEARKNGNSLTVGIEKPTKGSVDGDYELFKPHNRGGAQPQVDDRILGQTIGSGTRQVTRRPLTDHRAPSPADVADTSGWNRFPEAAGGTAVFDRGNGHSTLAETHRHGTPRRTGGGWIAPAVAAVTAGGAALVSGAGAAEAASHAGNAAADATPVVGALNAARQGRRAESTQRQFDDLTFGLHGEIARPLQRYFNGRGDNVAEAERIDPSMGETLIRSVAGLGQIGYRKIENMVRGTGGDNSPTALGQHATIDAPLPTPVSTQHAEGKTR